MPTIETSRGKIWAAIHHRASNAPSAILIHGAGGAHLNFPASLRRLPSIRPIVIDLPGHGASRGAGRSSIAEYTLDVLALMDSLALQSAIIIGHSMGGAIAQFLALEHSSRVLALALIGTGARLPVNPALIQGIMSDTETTLGNLARWMWSKNAPTDVKRQTAEIMNATAPAVIRNDLIACDNFDLLNQLPRISAPTLLVAGAQDKMTPVALSEQLHAGIPNSSLEVIPATGHLPHLEQPEHTAAVIDKWLRSNAPSASVS